MDSVERFGAPVPAPAPANALDPLQAKPTEVPSTMSYTPDSEKIEEEKEALIKAIKDFNRKIFKGLAVFI